jgi:hypothetical protein
VHVDGLLGPRGEGFALACRGQSENFLTVLSRLGVAASLFWCGRDRSHPSSATSHEYLHHAHRLRARGHLPRRRRGPRRHLSRRLIRPCACPSFAPKPVHRPLVSFLVKEFTIPWASPSAPSAAVPEDARHAVATGSPRTARPAAAASARVAEARARTRCDMTAGVVFDWAGPNTDFKFRFEWIPSDDTWRSRSSPI